MRHYRISDILHDPSTITKINEKKTEKKMKPEIIFVYIIDRYQ